VVVARVFVVAAELDRIQLRCHLEDVGSIGGGTFEDVEETLLETEPVGDHEIGFEEHGHLLLGRLVVMGISTDRDEDLHPCFVPDYLAGDIAPDRSGCHHQRQIGIVVGGGGAASHQQHGQEGRDQKKSSHLTPLNFSLKMRIVIMILRIIITRVDR
jgi:hypothetical protein